MASELKQDIGVIVEILQRFGAHEKLYKQQKEKREISEHEPQERKYLDDINDIFPWIPRGTYVRVS